MGDYARHVQDQIIDAAGGIELAALHEALQQGMKEMRQDLGFDEANLLERLLIEQVVLCWLHLYWAHYGYTRQIASGITFAHGTYLEKKLNAAQYWFLRASQTLARVRKLNISVQVNIAQQQTNVAAS